MKRVYVAGELPAPLQATLDATLAALQKKYGARAVMVGTHIENLATVATLVASTELPPEERSRAAEMTRRICSDVIRALAQALDVDAAPAFAVARALQDYSRQVETELVGEAPTPAAIVDEAAAVLAKARSMH